MATLERDYSDAATQVTHRLTPSTKTSEQFGSDYGIPTYMKAKAAFEGLLGVQRQNSFNLSRGIPVEYRSPPEVDKWRVRSVDPNEWRRNSIDTAYGFRYLNDIMTLERVRSYECLLDRFCRSLYTMKPETVAEKGELPQEPSKIRSEDEGEFFTGIDYNHAREKSYIRRTALEDFSPVFDLMEQRRFTSHIMQGYNKPKRREAPGYGVPRDMKLVDKVKTTNDVVEMVVRPPSSYNVMPKRQKPAKCDRPSMVACEFCDVLGPLSCNQCIESTNRRIAHDVEHAAFPEIDCTASALVAPTLSQLMLKRDSSRKKRVHHGRVDTIIEPALDKTKPSLVLPPIDNGKSTVDGKLAKALTPRTFGRPTIEREWQKRARGISPTYKRPTPTSSYTKLPDIGMRSTNTFQRVKRNIAGA